MRSRILCQAAHGAQVQGVTFFVGISQYAMMSNQSKHRACYFVSSSRGKRLSKLQEPQIYLPLTDQKKFRRPIP
jgi:hypothetical protein